MKHLDTLDLNSNSRRPVLSLREQNLTAESCEALEEVLKRVSHIMSIIIMRTIRTQTLFHFQFESVIIECSAVTENKTKNSHNN